MGLYIGEGSRKRAIPAESLSIEDYVDNKIDMLVNEFKCDISRSDTLKMYDLNSKVAVDNFARSILRKHLGD